MNIGKKKKEVIKLLYKQGITLEEIQIVSGLSKKTIQEILTPKGGLDALMEQINEAFHKVGEGRKVKPE